MKQLVELEGKTLRLSISDFSRDICLRIVADGIVFDSDIDEFDVSIHGKAIALMGLLTAGKGGGKFSPKISPYKVIFTLLNRSRPLPERWILIGKNYYPAMSVTSQPIKWDAPLKPVCERRKISFNRCKTAAVNTCVMKPRFCLIQGLIDEFSRDVETLRDDTERLSQRVQRLQNRVSKKVDVLDV